MDKAAFREKAKEICLESFNAYFTENDFPKSCKDMPPEHFKSFCIDRLRQCVNYEEFLDYLMPTNCYESKATAENIQISVPFATEELCVVFLTANINFLIDNGYTLQFHGRVSYVVAQNQGKPEILHLHFSMPHKNICNINLPNHEDNPGLYISGISDQDKQGAATAAGMYSPNGLIFYQISGNDKIGLVNASLLQLLGYASNKDLQEHTHGNLKNLLLTEDWPRVQQELNRREAGRVFNMNASFLRKDGTSVEVLLRGNYVDKHNKFFILSVTPLFVPEEQLYYGDFSEEEQYAEDYSIPYELFLKIALDIFVKHGREQGIPHLLELTTAVLNAHNGWICDVRDLPNPIKLVRYFTTPGYKKVIPVNMPSRCCLYYCHKFPTNAYDSPEEMPPPMQGLCRERGITSWMFNIISVNNKESFILYFLRQENAKPWTNNEKKIMHYTSKMFALLLDGYVQKHPSQGYLNGGAQ